MNTTIKNRIASIDLLRGITMIIMAIDHVRDYLYAGSFLNDPLDLTKTSGPVFLTRWVTHVCVPIFLLLAGTSAFLSGQNKTKKELSMFLVKRGFWLIFLEMFVLNIGWNFNLAFPMFFFSTIWALGISMIILAAFIKLPVKFIVGICFIIIAGHNLLDGIHIEGSSLQAFGWSLIHDQRIFNTKGILLLVGYPMIPLIAIMPLGYCLGNWYTADYNSDQRRRNLLMTGSGCLAAFVILRYTNLYGDPVNWSTQKNALFTFFSFINVNKYPPSLLYLLVTLGAAFLFLSFAERLKGHFVNVISVFGRVPMFYYIIHIYLIHTIAIVASLLTTGQDPGVWVFTQPIFFNKDLKGYGFSLPVTYLIWLGIVTVLFPLCRWYDAYKQAHKDKWWLSYL